MLDSSPASTDRSMVWYMALPPPQHNTNRCQHRSGVRPALAVKTGAHSGPGRGLAIPALQRPSAPAVLPGAPWAQSAAFIRYMCRVVPPSSRISPALSAPPVAVPVGSVVPGKIEKRGNRTGSRRRDKEDPLRCLQREGFRSAGGGVLRVVRVDSGPGPAPSGHRVTVPAARPRRRWKRRRANRPKPSTTPPAQTTSVCAGSLRGAHLVRLRHRPSGNSRVSSQPRPLSGWRW